MNDIICPSCKKSFKIDEAGFADILKQIRDHTFDEELQGRLNIVRNDNENAIKLLKSDFASRMQTEFSKKETEIIEVNAKLENAEIQKKLAVSDATSKIEKERDNLANDLKLKESEYKLNEKSLNERFSETIKFKDDEIERLANHKVKQSTKLVGETLEQHCEIEFNKLRAAGFQKAYFEKDNDSSSGSKGDYIYKEADDNGIEIISIMFEMKNENDDTVNKKKNNDFLKELDKDRVEKKCEYAVLVSLLEVDNELYNSGIYDVSHKFPKMYVVRPQFFVPIITILRNAAMNSMKAKAELAMVKSQNIDITNFENRINEFKEGFAKNYDLASRKFKTAIDEIDKTIDHLQKTKDALLSSENNLRIANSKTEELTIKKLTRENVTMAEKFSQLSSLN